MQLQAQAELSLEESDFQLNSFFCHLFERMCLFLFHVSGCFAPMCVCEPTTSVSCALGGQRNCSYRWQ